MTTDGRPAADVRQTLRALPKAHLHIHLEGAMRPTTLTELCRRYGIARPPDTQGRKFADFGGFVDVFWAACDALRSRDDLARLIHEVAEDAAEQGVWWLEPAFDAERYSDSSLRAGRPPPLFSGQLEGWRFALAQAEAAGKATGVGIGFISAADRTMPVERAEQRARLSAQLVVSGEHLIASGMPCFSGCHPGIVGFGLHGNEQGFPPEPFAEAFRIARQAGLAALPHAGEIAPGPGAGPASVAAAVDLLGARRVQHGVLAAADPALVARLARHDICLDVCPSSNLQLSVFPSLNEHPLPALLDAGVACSLGSDDPLLFGPDLVDEYLLCYQQLGFGFGRLAALAKHSFSYSGAPPPAVAAGLAAVDGWLNRVTTEDKHE